MPESVCVLLRDVRGYMREEFNTGVRSRLCIHMSHELCNDSRTVCKSRNMYVSHGVCVCCCAMCGSTCASNAAQGRVVVCVYQSQNINLSHELCI